MVRMGQNVAMAGIICVEGEREDNREEFCDTSKGTLWFPGAVGTEMSYQ